MQILMLVVFIVACELAGAAGSIFTVRAISGWYATLTKPALNPPSWIFGSVWTTLYLLMGIAAYLVWRNGFARADVRAALVIFAVQLVLNIAWSVIFFGAHNPAGAFIDIILLWLAILAATVMFYKISPSAAYLLVPYILWVSFAAYLNYAIWMLN